MSQILIDFPLLALQSPPCTWSSAFVVAARSVRRRITPLPRRLSTSIRRWSLLLWSITRSVIREKSPVWGGSVQVRTAAVVSSWPTTRIGSTAESVALPTWSNSSMSPNRFPFLWSLKFQCSRTEIQTLKSHSDSNVLPAFSSADVSLTYFTNI